MTLLRAVKGMNDVLPEESARWQYIEQAYARTMNLHGFREVRTPYVEPTSLFVRAMGDTTDVVEKEMYSFQHHGDSLTLRPEGTAGAVRAYLEHAVSSREPVTRWWYAGPMFRAERPQRGRYRQFFQLGAEIFGDDGPGCDAEMITMLFELMRELEVPDVHLLINSLGGPQVRRRYREALVEHLTPRSDSLSTDSQRRLRTNPLRVLDSKDERDQAAVLGAPTIHEFLDPGDREHFAKLCTYLDTLGTPYTVDARLVRGIDYYTRTLFEIQGARDKLGAGSTLVGGGRYDGLVADLGGPAVSAIGFAAGLERLLIASDVAVSANSLDALVAPIGAEAIGPGLLLARQLRARGIRCDIDTRGSSLKSQLRRANQLRARMVLIVGESELADDAVQVKDLDAHTQERMPREQALRVVAERLMTASGGVDAPVRRDAAERR
ncbi:MAG: histidine--tRNA ligase [Polyangiaceae bacterium]|jgi:histidyl-tRNA synthetase